MEEEKLKSLSFKELMDKCRCYKAICTRQEGIIARQQHQIRNFRIMMLLRVRNNIDNIIFALVVVVFIIGIIIGASIQHFYSIHNLASDEVIIQMCRLLVK